jgi:hypothetical protein
MAPPSKTAVSRVFFDIGINLWPGSMVTSQDSTNDKVEMDLHPAGVLIVGVKGSAIVPYSRVKSITLA